MRTVLYILLTLITTVSYGQGINYDQNNGQWLIQNFQNQTDSIRQLTNGSQVHYISDTLYKGIILTLKDGKQIKLDLRYKDNFRGYTEIGADFQNFVLIAQRGDGSGNPAELRVINKVTGEDKWLGNYPFYLDNKNAIGVYKSYTDSSSQITIHDFSTNKTESYPYPDTGCLGGDCLEMVEFDEESFTVRFVDLKGNLTERSIKRKGAWKVDP